MVVHDADQYQSAAMRQRSRSSKLRPLIGAATKRLRTIAVEMPPGHERNVVLQKLREAEMACKLSGLINSPDLQPLT
jgi:hypothetical protein